MGSSLRQRLLHDYRADGIRNRRTDWQLYFWFSARLLGPAAIVLRLFDPRGGRLCAELISVELSFVAGVSLCGRFNRSGYSGQPIRPR